MREIESDMPIDAVIVLFDNDGYGGREGCSLSYHSDFSVLPLFCNLHIHSGRRMPQDIHQKLVLDSCMMWSSTPYHTLCNG